MPAADSPAIEYVWERSSLFVMARVEGNDGVNITQATLDGIVLYITKLPSKTVIVPPTFTVADVIFDTLQTDGRWTRDATGYNFGHLLDGNTYIQDPESVYALEYELTPVSSAPVIRSLVVKVKPHPLAGVP